MGGCCTEWLVGGGEWARWLVEMRVCPCAPTVCPRFTTPTPLFPAKPLFTPPSAFHSTNNSTDNSFCQLVVPQKKRFASCCAALHILRCEPFFFCFADEFAEVRNVTFCLADVLLASDQPLHADTDLCCSARSARSEFGPSVALVRFA